MERVITYNFKDNFIEKIADFLLKNFGKDFSRTAVVFGGKRPALFLKRACARKLKKSFIPPRIFSMDEFMEYTASGGHGVRYVSDLDSAYHVFTLAKTCAPGMLKGRETFNEFLPWAREIISFIEQLDLENISSESLRHVQKSADIGYEVPVNINVLLKHIVEIRSAYHGVLNDNNRYSRGLMYRAASRKVENTPFDEFEKILFCNFYYLHETELAVIKNVYTKGKGIYIFQGSQEGWSVLEKNAKRLNITIRPEEKIQETYDFNLYQGFDMHSQVCVAREILKKIKEKDKTLIVVPRPESVIPLLSEITPFLDEFNVSMGYPLKRTSLYALFDLLFKVQDSKKKDRYYAKDYLNVLMHPLVKNLCLSFDPAVSRVLVHKTEELLKGEEESSIGGSLFISLGEIENEKILFRLATETLQNMNLAVSTDECAGVLKQMHALLFEGWEKVNDFNAFAEKLRILLDVLVEKSMLKKYPLNIKVIEKIYAIQEEMGSSLFCREPFKKEEMWEIFQQKLKNEKISFSGSPLKGTQVLGLFETRSLNFENVMVIDANESILPKLTVYEPLIPREVMLSLGLNRLEKEEEIQRYQFMRLIAGAKNVHLIYEENREKEKSRFIEELLWEKQKKAHKLEQAGAPFARFAMHAASGEVHIEKTPEMIHFIKRSTYSASRLNVYLSCPLQFYYQYVLGLKEKDDLLEPPEASQVGSFIHELLEETFTGFINRKPNIGNAFSRYFFDLLDAKFEREIQRRMRSDSFLLKGIIVERMERFLKHETERGVKKILGLEKDYEAEIILNKKPVAFTYTIDRIDEFRDKSILIIDYKTGSIDAIPKKLKTLETMEMTRESIQENIKSFQLPLYYYFIARDFPDRRVNAVLYSLRTLEQKPFISEKDELEKDTIMNICIAALEHIMKELFDPNTPFTPDKDERTCRYCPFTSMCR